MTCFAAALNLKTIHHWACVLRKFVFFVLLRFKINFQTGESDGENIAFHINPRIGELVALNSFRNGSWETEEHASITPFAKEGALNMNIVINSEGYEVCFLNQWADMYTKN